MESSLEELREEINEVNQQLLELINIRTMLIKQISMIKDEEGIRYFDELRVQEMLEHLIKANRGPLPDKFINDIFNKIFSTSLEFMDLKKDKLIVSPGEKKKFLNIQQIFNLQNDLPIIIAGPCSIENYDYLDKIGSLLCKSKIKFIRGGAYKPRSSPYDFQGLRIEGLKMIKDVGRKYDLITVSEVVDTRDVGMIANYVDVFQIGARNMQNFELLKEVGRSKHPVILKRGIGATIQEFIFAAEYIALQGNRKIILCERGIRTFETKTRNTLDIASIPILKKETELPIIVDLSHSLGRKDIVDSVAKAAIAVGADGLMLEVHPYPELALSDSKQQLNPQELEKFIKNFELKIV